MMRDNLKTTVRMQPPNVEFSKEYLGNDVGYYKPVQ